MKSVACFDIGTTSIKGVLIQKNGGIFGAVSVPIKTYNLSNGYVEQNTSDWWRGIQNIFNTWKKNNFYSLDIAAVVLSGQMQDMISIDQDAVPIRRAILYPDSRANSQAEKIINKLGFDHIISTTQTLIDSKKSIRQSKIYSISATPKLLLKQCRT